MSFSAPQFKQQFPLFSQPENRDLVYLDNAATTQKPAVVIDAIRDFYLHSNANTHRSSHRLARQATAMVEQVRAQAAAFLGTDNVRELIFTRGATESLNLLASSLCAGLEPGDEIVLSTAEHHANLVPWQMAAACHQLHIRYVPDARGIPQFARLEEVLTPRTRIVSMTAGSNALGFRTDLELVRGILAGRNLRWVLDASQLAAHAPISVRAIGCDFLVCSAHKFYGPSGIGLLYGREQWLQEMPPWQGGGEMIADVDLHSSHYAGLPHKFEAGTSSLAAIAGLGACLDFLHHQDRAAMAAHEQMLLRTLHEQVSGLPGMTLLSSAENNLGILTFSDSRFAPVDLMHWLDGKDIAVRVGHHCAQPLIRASGHSATLRASLAAYNTEQDVARFVAAVAEFLEQLDSAGNAEPHPEVEVAEGWPVDDFSALDLEELRKRRGWQERYRLLMQWSKAIAPKPAIRLPEHSVKGCESSAWLAHCAQDGKHYFALDSDSRVVKGLGAFLLMQLNGQSTESIREINLEQVFKELEFDKHLSPSRSNGFYALMRRVGEIVDVEP
ncbi:aminotransferase class V-fold PLP-dependent enzyme [Microbulbifer sp. SA54]|uniref:aminotransferase class V-fold PLP-dependent enzyme n=1 Tax=Microbulbifer sp. SA54 TaxID=3401577 RepID=UPI003AAA81A7